MLRVVNQHPDLPLDGYGMPFDPNRHWRFVRAGVEYLSHVPREPLPPPVTELKDKPAGWRSPESVGSGV